MILKYEKNNINYYFFNMNRYILNKIKQMFEKKP